MCVSGHEDIFDMANIDLFSVVALNMMVVKLGYAGESKPMFYNYLRPLASLDEGLYAFACEEDVHCLATLVRSIKLIEVYIEHDVIALDSYLRAPQFMATIEDITDEPGSITSNRTEKMLLHDRSDLKAESNGEAGFADVAVSGVESFRTKEPILAEIRVQEPFVEEVRTREPTMKDVVLEDYVSSCEDVEHAWILLFANISVTNLVLDDVLEREDVDVINVDGFDNDSCNYDETKNYRRRRAKFNLLLNNICEAFNGKIVGGRDKPVITLLEYIREYCMKRIVNVQSVINKCIVPLNPTATRIVESIKKEAHFMNVQWNGANKYQVSSSLGDHCVVDVATMTCSCKKWELTGIPCKHVADQGKHEDEPFVKDGKLSKKGRTITCQSCENTEHNNATCKVQGRKATTGANSAEASGSASRQAQQTKPLVGQDGLGGLGGLGVGTVIGLSVAAGQGGASGPGGAGLGIQDKGTEITKDKVSQEHACEEEGMDDYVPDEIDGAKCEHVPTHVVNKGNLEVLVCNQAANHGSDELVDKGRPLKRKRVYAE
uniref:SWIM-type domain-containing protein n=1 Tax=Tanacetum cinerariifolium TaxID=118510 RepID=A0A699GMX3_TANCI|nr:hypothetical protein [Tanacetum cinerariifolium]